MWVFCNDAFVSAVEHFDDPALLVVRARREGDLQRFFADDSLAVERHEDRDYLFRTIMAKVRFADVLARRGRDIDYHNFKGSIRDRAYHDACLDVWSVMNRLQRAGRKAGS